MANIDLSRLFQSSVKHQNNILQESTQASEINDELYTELFDSLKRTYRGLTGQETVGDKLHNLGNRIGDSASSIGGKIGSAVSSAGNAVSKFAKENPGAAGGLAAGAGAIGAGLAVNRFLNRRRRRR